jgi:hypothetical protein
MDFCILDKEYLFFLELFSSINVGFSLFLNNVEAINLTDGKARVRAIKGEPYRLTSGQNKNNK